MLKTLGYLRPKLLAVPPNIDEPNVLKDYLETIVTELQIFFAKMVDVIPDKGMDAVSQLVNLGALFTIDPQNFFIDMQVTAARTSHATTAIKKGRSNQRVVLHNRSSFNITIVNGANTILNGSVNAVLTPDGTLTLRWNGTKWAELGRSIP